MVEIKRCQKCGCDKPAVYDHWRIRNGKVHSPCRECLRAYERERRKHSDVKVQRLNLQRKYRQNPEFRARKNEKERERCKDPAAYARKRQQGRDYMRERCKDPQVKAQKAKRMRERYRSDPEYKARVRAQQRQRYARPSVKESIRTNSKLKLDNRVRNSVLNALRRVGASKTTSKLNLLGWSISELMRHLEPLFEEGMGWHNMGKWEIDHIIPLSAVKYKSESDPLFKRVWALSNLAPLWKADNNSKLASLKWQLPDAYRNPHLRAIYDNRDYTMVTKQSPIDMPHVSTVR